MSRDGTEVRVGRPRPKWHCPHPVGPLALGTGGAMSLGGAQVRPYTLFLPVPDPPPRSLEGEQETCAGLGAGRGASELSGTVEFCVLRTGMAEAACRGPAGAGG